MVTPPRHESNAAEVSRTVEKTGFHSTTRSPTRPNYCYLTRPFSFKKSGLAILLFHTREFIVRTSQPLRNVTIKIDGRFELFFFNVLMRCVGHVD